MNVSLFNRRKAIQTVLSAVCILPAARAFALEPLSTLYIPDQVDIALKQSIAFLAKAQDRTGAITDRSHPVAMTSLAIMAMASIGTQPSDEDEISRAMSRAIDFVLTPKHQNNEGFFGDSDNSRMYGHGITTLMLTEVLGMGETAAQNEKIHRALVPAIKLILESQKVPKPQSNQGGWRYTPKSGDADLSVSVWQLMALRSAKNDGMDVPGEAIDAAVEYLRESYVTHGRRGKEKNELAKVSGFSYTPGSHQPTFTMTSAGLLAMQVCGLYDSPMVAGAAEWLLQHPPQLNERYFFYGLYYYAQGMHQFGGTHAEKAEALVAKLLIESQNQNGSWTPRGEEGNYGHVYATALATLSLSVRYHYLPIYQR